jgi:hypothetical protein
VREPSDRRGKCMSKETEYVLEITPPAPENPPALSVDFIK